MTYFYGKCHVYYLQLLSQNPGTYVHHIFCYIYPEIICIYCKCRSKKDRELTAENTALSEYELQRKERMKRNKREFDDYFASHCATKKTKSNKVQVIFHNCIKINIYVFIRQLSLHLLESLWRSNVPSTLRGL